MTLDLSNSGRVYGVIRAVYVDGSPADADSAGFAETLTFDIDVQTSTGPVALAGVQTFVPYPTTSDYEVLAGTGVYVDRLVDVIEDGPDLWPMIPLFPAWEDCG